MLEPKKKVKNKPIVYPSPTMASNDQVQENHVSSMRSIDYAYDDETRSQDDEILLDVSDLQVDDSTIGLSYSSLLNVENQANDSPMFASIHKEMEILNEFPTLQLKEFRRPDHHQVSDEFMALLSGSTSLTEEILDLVFDLKPQGNFSSMMYGLEHFVPNNKIENFILLGLLKRSMILYGTKDILLSKSRYTDVDALSTLANEFVLSLLKFNQCDLLLQLLETIVISSNYSSNILLQYGLLLDKMGHHKMALDYFIIIADVLEACYLYFIIIQIYYVHLNDFESGIDWCHKVLSLKQVRCDAGLKSKCYLYLGVGCFRKHLRKKDTKSNIFTNQQKTLPIINYEKDVYLFGTISSDKCYLIDASDISISEIDLVQSETRIPEDENVLKSCSSTVSNMNGDITQSSLEIAMSHLLKASAYDCHNPVIYYYLSLISAQGGNIEQAMTYVKHSLQLNAEYLPSLHLLVLLKSSHNLFSAQSLLESVQSEYPDHVQLYITQAHISLSQRNYTKALNEMREALIVWKKLYGDKEGDGGYFYADDDSGQFSEDYQDKMNPNCTCSSETNNAFLNINAESNSNTSSDSQLKSDTKHVTFHFQKPHQNALSGRTSWQDMATSFLHFDKNSSRVESFYNLVTKTFYSCTICHDELPSKRRLLIDIWGMVARISLALNMEEDFVQCLSELLNICDVTIPYLGSIERSTIEPMSSTVLSQHCTEISLHLGLYFQRRRDLTKARACFKSVLSISKNHVEAMYHRACIERDLCFLNRALLTTQQCLQLNNVGIFKAKLYFLMGDIYDALGEPDNALVAYEMALILNDTIPVCSYDIIPFVLK